MPVRPRLTEEQLAAQVMAVYMPHGRVDQLPAKHKKRLIVLRWLADLFRPARRYSETQVNDVLRRYAEDYVTVRRYLVDEELMQRGRGLYWRAGTMPFPSEAGT
jgi:hypothetical protein